MSSNNQVNSKNVFQKQLTKDILPKVADHGNFVKTNCGFNMNITIIRMNLRPWWLLLLTEIFSKLWLILKISDPFDCRMQSGSPTILEKITISSSLYKTCTNYMNLKFKELSDKNLGSSNKTVSKHFPCYAKAKPMSTVKMSFDVRKHEKSPYVFLSLHLSVIVWM